MITSKRRLAGLGGFLMMAIVSCGDTPEAALRASIAEGCSINSECSSPLVCAFRTCHVECSTTRDCVAFGGGLCVQSDKPYRVCQHPKESSCIRNSECPGQQICGVDAKCRDACVTNRDCGSNQACSAGVCADTEELIDGALPSKTPPSPSGGTSCLRASDCPGDLICLFDTCTVECVTAKDCDDGRACVASRCAVPNTSGAGGSAGTAGASGAAGRAGGGATAGSTGVAGSSGATTSAAGSGGTTTGSAGAGLAGAPAGGSTSGTAGTAGIAGASTAAGMGGAAGSTTGASGSTSAGAGGAAGRSGGGGDAGAGGAGGGDAGSAGEAGASGSDAGSGGSDAGAGGSDAGSGGSDAGAAGSDAGAAGSGGSDAGAAGAGGQPALPPIARCDGFNEGSTPSTGQWGNRYVAFQYVPTESRTVAGFDWLTGTGGPQSGPDVYLALFDDVGGKPGSPIAPSSTFNVPGGATDWYGGRLSVPVAVTAGTAYWIVFRPMGGVSAMSSTPGTALKYRGSDDLASWDGPYSAPFMIRVECPVP